MAISRKPVPAPGQLPYPVTPTSPKPTFLDETPDQSTSQEPTASINSYLERPGFTRSHNSSVSDLSEGWVDGQLPEGDDRPSVRQEDLAPTTPPKETNVPATLQAGSRAAGLPRIPSPGIGGRSSTGLDQLEEPAIPASLRVTPPPNKNNPFIRARSPGCRDTSTERIKQSAQDDDVWADIAGTPPRKSPSPQPGSSPHIGTLSLQDGPPKQYRPYSPMGANPALNRPSDSVPEASYQTEPQNEVPPPPAPMAPVELPTSPAGHQPKPSQEDVYSNLEALEPTPVPLYEAPPPPNYAPPALPAAEAPPLPERKIPPTELPPPLPDRKINSTDLPIPVENSKGKAPIHQFEAGPASVPSLKTQELPAAVNATRSEVETPVTRANRQRAETYSVKKIRWQDAYSPELRSTPIMVQNANGPCPLLALVNALTLSSPPHATSALVETLRSREQVTLGLLLDAVFDELMSRRRDVGPQELPDVGDLYSFLLTLHTGMNVNPRFLPPEQEPDLMDGFDSPTSPCGDSHRPPGGFEDTREMKLYSTFAIPLVHGWLPPRTHPAYAALKRSAVTYEDAQNLMFREEELEEKLQRGGLTAEEQQLLEDIATVKYFLNSSATQLTSYGLDVVTDSMDPGAIAIFFRNDHFSTLYKHPRSGQLLTLVTDMGYAGHEEVVWESLVDVSGEGCEFYSGDFRPVGFGGSPPPSQDTSRQDAAGWTTVQHAGEKYTAAEGPAGPAATLGANEDEYNIPSGRNTEQEDADLALAMQLQEEEEDRERRAVAARKREEEEASQAFLSQEVTNQPGSNTAPRGSSRRGGPQQAPALFPNYGPGANRRGNPSPITSPVTATANRRGQRAGSGSGPTPGAPAVSSPPPRRQDPEGSEDAPPPTYEQAARATPYHGPVPNNSSDSYAQMRANNGASAGDPFTRNRAMSAYSQHRASLPGQPPPNPGTARRRASGAAGILPPTVTMVGEQRERERDKDCIVM